MGKKKHRKPKNKVLNILQKKNLNYWTFLLYRKSLITNLLDCQILKHKSNKTMCVLMATIFFFYFILFCLCFGCFTIHITWLNLRLLLMFILFLLPFNSILFYKCQIIKSLIIANVNLYIVDVFLKISFSYNKTCCHYIKCLYFVIVSIPSDTIP